jgi:sialic acid synthase SpsE
MTKLIAEIGWNHMGNMNLAKKMILEAKKNGADLVKTQVFNTKYLKKGPWDKDGRTQIYKKAELNLEKYNELFNYSKKIDTVFFASAMDIHDAELISKVSNNLIKIPSMESRNIHLIQYCNKKFRKVIMSSGTSTFKELIKSTSRMNPKKFIIMHCVSSYPCEFSNINLPKIKFLKKYFSKVGFSDHTLGIKASTISLQYYPDYIEKHFTIDRKLPGRDNAFAILPKELKELKEFIKIYSETNTNHGKNYLNCEKEARKVYSGRWQKK